MLSDKVAGQGISAGFIQRFAAQGGAQPGGSTQKPGDDGVVDADYESVD